MALIQPEPVMCPASEASRDAGRRRQPSREFAARTYARSLPVVPARARGMTIEDSDGRRYLDCLSGGGSLALGHNHPVVLEAIRSVLHPGARGRTGGWAAVRDRFAAELSRSLPPELADSGRIRICGPGAGEALAAAADLVRKATGRRSLVVFTGSHPGAADGPVPDAGAAPPVTRLPYPHDYRCPFGIGGRRGWELCLRRARDLIDRSGERPAPAGVLVEPVQGERGGVVPAPDAWLHRLRELTGEQGIPLVVDESETGVGRTGAFWAVGHSGVVPDVMLLSRAIGGSLPLAVLVHRAELGDPPTGPDSFRGNQLAMAAGAAGLAYVRGNRLDERAALLGERMLRRLRELALHHPCLGDVRGRGLMIGVELVDPVAPGPGGPVPRTGARPAAPAPRLAAALQRECLRRGLIVGLGGPEANVVRLLPPLTMSGEQAESVLDRLGDALAALERTGDRVPV